MTNWNPISTPEAQGELAVIEGKLTRFLVELGAKPELIVHDTTLYNYKDKFKFSIQVLVQAVKED